MFQLVKNKLIINYIMNFNCGTKHRKLLYNGQNVKHGDILIDENLNQTNIFISGKKSGIHSGVINELNFFKSKLKNYKFVGNFAGFSPSKCTKSKYKIENYDAIMDVKNTTTKSLNMLHSVSDRSLPLMNGYYYENDNNEREYDFFIYSVIGEGTNIKGYNIATKLIPFLCEKGLKGICLFKGKKIYNFEKYTKQGLLKIHYGLLKGKAFPKYASNAKFWIHPNKWDAFPKTIIESLLLDMGSIINKELDMGLNYVKDISSAFIVDYNDFNNIYKIIKNTNFEKLTPRKDWLEKYSFHKVGAIWATEINKYFNTDYKELYYLTDLIRIKKFIPRYMDISN